MRRRLGVEVGGILRAVMTTLRARLGALARRLLRRDATYYPSAYRKADLERDYWSIVGPASAEEFRALGEGKRELLIERGLLPTSRLLDVGCGTGQLTAAVEDYLSPAGVYVGTDIAAEAVEFCRRRFTRPNFRFAQSARSPRTLTSPWHGTRRRPSGSPP